MFYNLRALPKIRDLNCIDFLRIDKAKHVKKMREISYLFKGAERKSKRKELEEQEAEVDAKRTMEFY